jgi:hypothetical protein
MNPRTHTAIPLLDSIRQHDTFAFGAVVWFMFFANIYDMGGVFGIKYLSYAVVGVFLVFHYRSFRLRLEALP